MEYLLVAVLLYFIARTAGNLVELLRGGDPASSRRGVADPASGAGHNWEGPSPRQETGQERDEPTFWGEDVEDATWYDVEDTSTAH